MTTKRIILIITVLLIGFSVIDFWRFPSDIEPVPDDSFGETAGKKDQAFGDVLSGGEDGFERALKPRKFSFPEDHGPHNRYRIEWWYFTGNLQNSEGRKFGYQLTFFRYALSPDKPASKSAWRTNQLYMAHFTVTDVTAGRFYTDERFSRAGNGLAGADSRRFHVWLYDWSAQAEETPDFPLHLQAKNEEIAIDLHLTKLKPKVLQGNQGLSRKSDEPGNASYYYSFTRLPTEGAVTVGGNSYSVKGSSWMDREWSTSSLSKQQEGWDWLALQFSDGSELMFYRLRRKDGRVDGNSAGSFIAADNARLSLNVQDVVIEVKDHWQSPHSKAVYPSRWRLSVPKLKLSVDIVPLVSDQELNVSTRYWEGAVSINGTRNGNSLTGRGYVELTGYEHRPK
ncbi:MAG: lipocalin-like domain-containing protein [Gammaproteobacteria bacterium]